MSEKLEHISPTSSQSKFPNTKKSSIAGPVKKLIFNFMKTTVMSPISEIASALCEASLSTPTSTKLKGTRTGKS